MNVEQARYGKAWFLNEREAGGRLYRNMARVTYCGRHISALASGTRVPGGKNLKSFNESARIICYESYSTRLPLRFSVPREKHEIGNPSLSSGTRKTREKVKPGRKYRVS